MCECFSARSRPMFSWLTAGLFTTQRHAAWSLTSAHKRSSMTQSRGNPCCCCYTHGDASAEPSPTRASRTRPRRDAKIQSIDSTRTCSTGPDFVNTRGGFRDSFRRVCVSLPQAFDFVKRILSMLHRIHETVIDGDHYTRTRSRAGCGRCIE